MFEVFIRDLEFYAYHGVSEEEQKVGHHFRASVTVRVDGNADQTDKIMSTVDYGALASSVVSVATSASYSTVERVAGLVAEAVLIEFALVQECSVELVKILPPQPSGWNLGVLGEAGCRVSRSRAGS